MAAVVVTVTVMVGRHDGLHAGLPDHRGLHKGLTGSGHGRIGVAPPLVAIGINLRRYKERAVILLLRRSRRHYRCNNIAGLRIAVLCGDAPVIKILAL